MSGENFKSFDSFGNFTSEGVEGFFMPRALLREDELCTTEKLVLCEIIGISNGKDDCSINNEEIAEMLRLSSKTIANTITSLIKKEYIEIKIEFLPGTQKQIRRIIVLTFKLKNLFCNKKIEKIEVVEKESKEIVEKDPVIEVAEEAKIENPENGKFNNNGNLEIGNLPEINNPKIENENPEFGNLPKNEAPDLGIISNVSNVYNNNLNNNIKINEEINKEINKEEKNNKNIKINVNPNPNLNLDVISLLGEKEYSKLNKNTKRNIIKNFPNLKSEDFKRIYNQVVVEEEQGFTNDFDATFYLALKGKWRYRAAVNSQPKMECAEEKIRWFKSSFGGIKIEEYLELLAKIPYDVLLKNRQRLGKLSIYEFRTEFRKLSFLEK